MFRVNVFDRDGQSSAVDAEEGLPLMFALREGGLPVEGTCGGTAGCGTCHVFVEDGWMAQLAQPQATELDMLQALENYDPARSRLSCQIEMGPQLDGLVVTLAPEEFV
ncbi:2Fe-2S ferredoxin [Mesorhizobium sp. J18]|nr:2Fe-2S ferredoxin [Mesorhizobium sp. J18]